MGLAYAIILVIFGAITGRMWRSPYIGSPGDLLWQEKLGAYVLAHHALPVALGNETFTAPGAPWTPQEWLLSVAVSWFDSRGMLEALVVVVGISFALALLLTAVRAKRFGASSMAIAVVLLLCALNSEASFGIRAQTFAWTLFVLLLYVLDLDGPVIFSALAVTTAWANLHASVMLAIPIVWIDAASALLRRGIGDAGARSRLLLAALVPFTTLLTPLGVRLPEYALMLLRSPIRHAINEWEPLSLHSTFFYYGGVPLLLLIVLAVRTLWRERPRDMVWAALLLAMTFEGVRNAPLFGFVAAPLAARAYTVLVNRVPLKQVPEKSSAISRALWVVGSLVVAVLAFAYTATRPLDADVLTPPIATFDRLAARPGRHRIFCDDFAVCSAALDHPNLLVFMDGRADPYPLWVWDQFNAIRSAKPGWSALLDRYHVDEVVVYRDGTLNRALAAQPRRWQVVDANDLCCRAYVRR